METKAEINSLCEEAKEIINRADLKDGLNFELVIYNHSNLDMHLFIGAKVKGNRVEMVDNKLANVESMFLDEVLRIDIIEKVLNGLKKNEND